MSKDSEIGQRPPRWRPSKTQILGLVLGVVLVTFIVTNNSQTTATILFVDVTMRLWMLISLTAALGLGVGFLLGRRPRD